MSQKDPFSFNKKVTHTGSSPVKGGVCWTNKGDERFRKPVTVKAAQKKFGSTSQGILPWILAGSIGVGGGGAASQFLGNANAVTPAQLERHVDRVIDKVDDVAEDIRDLKARVKHVEKDVTDIKYDRARIKNPNFGH